MKLIKQFYLKDIKNFEDNTGLNIIKIFDDCRMCEILELVRLGNNNCSLDEASNILELYLRSGKNYIDAVKELQLCLFGNNNSKEKGDIVDITQYDSLTALYRKFCSDLLCDGLTYSEFWQMNTDEMYKIANIINIKNINEMNRQLYIGYINAGLSGQSHWGKLQKDIPQINLDKFNDNPDVDTISEEHYNQMISKMKLWQILNNTGGLGDGR